MEVFICSHESALLVYKNTHEIERKVGISRSSVRRIAKHDLRLKTYKRLSWLYAIEDATLFSKVVSDNLRLNPQSETLAKTLCALILFRTDADYT